MSPTKQETGLTAEEKAAMKALMKERKAAIEGEEAVAASLKEMTPADRALGKRIHELIKDAAPSLTPKTWYGMPAYANKDGKVVVFFRDAGKFNERYSMLGFNEAANLDSGAMWPIAYALPKLAKADEAKIAKLIKQAVS
jgi:uncharacterized protein YdhG (YjbR/CyaY superfamily)